MNQKMIDLNRELLLDELSNFEKQKSGEIPDILNKYLESVAQNGDTMFSWHKLQPLLRRKLEVVMNEFNELCPTDHLIPLSNVKPFDFEELKAQILEAIDGFCSAPFTIQRLCELITSPSKHYKRTDKFMRGIEKNILVVTTIEPKSANGSNTHYSTSSFKNLFSSLHSTSNSCQSSPSTSMLVNGIPEVICDNQMQIHCSNESIINPMSSPVSPNSLPLSPTTKSPPNQHLPPLQQLDSFTNVFASSPSTPLSVVSDLHSYEHSSGLSLMTPTNPISSANSDTKKDESCADLEPIVPNHKTDSTDSSSNTSIQTNINSDIKTEITQNNANNESKQTIDSNQSTDSSEENKDLSQTTDTENNNNNNINEEIVVNENKSIDSKNISIENQTNEKESICEKTNTSNDTISCDIKLIEEKTSILEEELRNGLKSSEKVENRPNTEIQSTNDEEMSQPMDFCGSNPNTDNNNVDITELNEKNNDLIPECNTMDETLSQSDQSEPMDED